MTSFSIRKLSLLCAAVAVAAGVAGTAQAQSAAASPDLHRLTVAYNDLNVNTASGATALYQRIRGAAHFVCGEEGRSIDEQAHWNSCVRAAVSQAVTSVHSPMLSALDAGRAPGTMPTALLGK